MRIVYDLQGKLGLVDIADLVFDPKSRDDIDKLLQGLQHIYTTPDVRDRVFAILEEVLPDQAEGPGKVSPHTGRPGMPQWNILVLGVLRLGLNADYDRIQNLANQHKNIRQMLGHGDWDDSFHYELQTLKDNLHLFTPAILDRINREVVGVGHATLKNHPEEQQALEARCDSFVVETDVAYPVDINLLYDAVRKAIEIAAKLSAEQGLAGWRQGSHLIQENPQPDPAAETLQGQGREETASTGQGDQAGLPRLSGHGLGAVAPFAGHPPGLGGAARDPVATGQAR